MEASNYPGNSHAKREAKAPIKNEAADPPRLEPVVQGKVVRRKKPLGKRFAETFVQGDDAQSVWSYIAFDVMIPAAQDMVVDAIQQGAERMFYGESRPRGRKTRGGGTGRTTLVSYDKYADQKERRDSEPRISKRARANHEFDEIVLSSRAEADEILDRMYDRLAQYDMVTVSDLYDLLNQTPDYTDRQWGWTDLQGSRVVRINGGGYVLDLPRPRKL